MSPRFVLGRENVPCVAEVVNRSLKADCTDFKSNAHPDVCISQLLCYSSSSWQRLGVSACAQFEIFVVKVGSACENKTDLDEKRIFHYKLLNKLSEAHRNISILKIPLYDTNS